MKIFTLEKAINQDEDRFIAIQKLFYHFEKADIHCRAIEEKVGAFEENLLDFTYDYSMKNIPKDVLKYINARLVTEHGQLQGETKKLGEQTFNKILKMGYTIDDFEIKGPEVVQIRDFLADLLQSLDL